MFENYIPLSVRVAEASAEGKSIFVHDPKGKAAEAYVSNGVSSYLPEHFFEKEPWYVRLVLEGEDRLDRNQRAKEQERTVSYSAISEEWEVIGNVEGNPLEYLVYRENRKEILHCLTERQRVAVSL